MAQSELYTLGDATLSSWQRRLIIWCEPIIRVDTSERRHHPQPHPPTLLPRQLPVNSLSLANNMLCHPAPHSTATNIFAILRAYPSYPSRFQLLIDIYVLIEWCVVTGIFSTRLSRAECICLSALTDSVALVRERTIPTELPPLVGKLIANFCGEKGVAWSGQRIPYGRNLGFLDRNSLEHSHEVLH
jgi:hypothetical protein